MIKQVTSGITSECQKKCNELQSSKILKYVSNQREAFTSNTMLLMDIVDAFKRNVKFCMRYEATYTPVRVGHYYNKEFPFCSK